METIEFKDVAHLYVGCMLRKGSVLSHLLIHEANEAAFNAWDDIKPILRPLSDISKDELSNLWNIVFNREFNGVIHKFKANDTGRGSYAAERYVMHSGVERLGVEFDGNIWADSDLSVWRYNKHKITAYLLSNHFDLFGLIESGEAIDKTTL